MSIEVLKVDEWLLKKQKRSAATLLEQLHSLLKDMQIQHEARRPYKPFGISEIKSK